MSVIGYTWFKMASSVVSSIQLTNVKPFDGNNYSNWNFRVKLILEQQGVLETISIVQDRKARRLLEVISSDICGPISPATYDGKKYFLSFIDHFSHFAMCYLLENKSEVLDKFKEYAAMAEAKFQKKIENLRCDNGGEYTSREFKTYCKQKGINIQYTVPYTPQ